jgi:hypothetical protein
VSTFIFKMIDDVKEEPITILTMELKDEVLLDNIVMHFSDFLKGCGFQHYALDIINEPDEIDKALDEAMESEPEVL